MIAAQNKKTLFFKGVVACTCKTTYSCACTYNSPHLLQYITVAALTWLSHTDGTSTLLHYCIILITTEVTSVCTSLKTLFK